MDGFKTFQSIAPHRGAASGPAGGAWRHASSPRTIFYAIDQVPSPEEIKQRIEAALPGSEVEVQDTTGTGDHFQATVSSETFAGLSRIEQHRLVYGALEADIGGAIHALALRTTAPTKIETP
jgi:stress-induced morphogen